MSLDENTKKIIKVASKKCFEIKSELGEIIFPIDDSDKILHTANIFSIFLSGFFADSKETNVSDTFRFILFFFNSSINTHFKIFKKYENNMERMIDLKSAFISVISETSKQIDRIINETKENENES